MLKHFCLSILVSSKTWFISYIMTLMSLDSSQPGCVREVGWPLTHWPLTIDIYSESWYNWWLCNWTCSLHTRVYWPTPLGDIKECAIYLSFTPKHISHQHQSRAAYRKIMFHFSDKDGSINIPSNVNWQARHSLEDDDFVIVLHSV